jgi:hypothetical protein
MYYLNELSILTVLYYIYIYLDGNLTNNRHVLCTLLPYFVKARDQIVIYLDEIYHSSSDNDRIQLYNNDRIIWTALVILKYGYRSSDWSVPADFDDNVCVV